MDQSYSAAAKWCRVRGACSATTSMTRAAAPVRALRACAFATLGRRYSRLAGAPIVVIGKPLRFQVPPKGAGKVIAVSSVALAGPV